MNTDPKLDEHQKQGVTGGTWIALILGALILVMLLIFMLQNNVPADFAYLGWTFQLPLGVAILFAAIAGVLVMALFGSVRLFKLGHRVRRLEKEREAIKRTIN
ncbi:LapA family protein [Nesterenkonia sp. CF4.4]|uniref:LapA family protein n=1 Tax=Nesterenkonia sp. CF4.4 TaxID=3373079 RepID=UPI003EE4C61C